MAFLGGKNTGGDRADYYDNPNFNPKDDGKSRGDKLLRKAAEYKAVADDLGEQIYVQNAPIEHEFLYEAEGEAAVAQMRADDQAKATVSYFRGKDKERLNPGGVSGKQINPKFSQPASLLTKLGKFGMSYDPVDPDTYYDEAFKLPDNVIQEKSRTYDTGSVRVGGNWNEETIEFIKGEPMPKTIAGVNQDLQARKARTRDFAMEFRGTVFDFIDEVAKGVRDDIAGEIADHMGKEFHGHEQPLSRKELEDKFFPDEASKKAAKTELRRMISFTDEISDINRNYSNIYDYAETILRTDFGSQAPFPLGVVNQGTDGGVDDKITYKNYQKSQKAYSNWKSKKGVPKIVRLISKLG